MRISFRRFASCKADQIVGTSIIGVALCFGLQTAEAQSVKSARSPKAKSSDEVAVLICTPKQVHYEQSGFNYPNTVDKVESGNCPGDETRTGQLIQPFCTDMSVVISAAEGWQISALQFNHTSTRPPEAGSSSSTSGTFSIDRATGKFRQTTTWESTTIPNAYQRWYASGICAKAVIERKF